MAKKTADRPGSEARRTSMPVKRTSTIWEDEVDDLFKTHTIVEIKEVEKRTRNDIERKKEDLRQMVGERYRDLIDAADTIMDMKVSTQHVVTTIKKLQDQCSRIGETAAASSTMQSTVQLHPQTHVLVSQRAGGDELQKKSAFYAISTAMKLLVDTPEHIWNAMETHQYLKAAQLYLLARQIFTSLRVNKMVSSNLFASFPILSVQWGAISSFKMEILAGCRAQLRHTSLPENATASSLLAIMLLGAKSPQQVLDELLAARLDALHKLFKAQGRDAVTVTAKQQICRIVDLVQATLIHVHAIYGNIEGTGLLYALLKEDTVPHKDGPSSTTDLKLDPSTAESDVSNVTLSKLYGYNSNTLTLVRHLPSSIQNFKATCPAEAYIRMAQSVLQQKCNQWLEDCTREVAGGLPGLLGHVTTVRALAACRDAVWQLLKDGPGSRDENGSEQNEAPSTDDQTDLPLPLSRSQVWSAVCQSVLGGESTVCLWSRLLRPLVLAHSVSLVQKECAALPPAMAQSIAQALDSLRANTAARDTNIGRYLWTEGDTDLDPATTTIQSESTASALTSSSSSGGGGPGGIGSVNSGKTLTWLSLKAAGITPASFTICGELDRRLAVVIADAKYAIEDEEKTGGDDPDKDGDLRGNRAAVRRQTDLRNGSDIKDEPFDRYADGPAVREALTGGCAQCMRTMCTEAQALMNTMAAQLNQAGGESEALVSKILFVGRTAKALADYSAQLPEAMKLPPRIVEAASVPSARRLFLSRRKSVEAGDQPVYDEQLKTCRDLLVAAHTQAVDIWLGWLAVCAVDKLRQQATREYYRDTRNFAWEDIRIAEEGEGGKVESTISIPTQNSPFVVSFLHQVCVEVVRGCGYGQDRDCIQRLVGRLGGPVLDHYADLAKDESIPQSGAVQLSIDLSVLSSFLSGRGDRQAQALVFASRVHEIESAIHQKIDPFDLSVFLPHLTAAVQKSTRRLSTLLGVLDPPPLPPLPPGASGRQSVSGGEQPNILPLAQNTPRFGLLPVSATTMAQRRQQQQQQQQTETKAGPSQPVSQAPKSPQQKGRQQTRPSLAMGEQATKLLEKGTSHLFAGSESLRSLLWGSYSNASDE